MSEALSGRELDAAVAERVMGWTHGQHGTNCVPPFVSCPVCSARFSTDIAAAWEVVHKIRDASRNPVSEPFKSFLKALSQGQGLDVAIWALTPERICRAALRAVEDR